MSAQTCAHGQYIRTCRCMPRCEAFSPYSRMSTRVYVCVHYHGQVSSKSSLPNAPLLSRVRAPAPPCPAWSGLLTTCGAFTGSLMISRCFPKVTDPFRMYVVFSLYGAWGIVSRCVPACVQHYFGILKDKLRNRDVPMLSVLRDWNLLLYVLCTRHGN